MRFLTMDFETVAPRHGDALCPWSDGFRVSAAGFANNFVNPTKPPMYDVRPWPTVENVTYALEQAVKHKALVMGANTMFEIAVCHRLGVPRDLINSVWWGDIFLWWKRVDMYHRLFVRTMFKKHKQTSQAVMNPLSYNLENAVKEFLPDEPEYKDFAGYDVPIGVVGTPEYEALLAYLKKDVMYTDTIAKKLYTILREDHRAMHSCMTDSAVLIQCAEAWYTGLDVDVQQLRAVYSRVMVDYHANAEVLKDNGLTPDVVRSPVKMRKLLFETWGLPVIKTKKDTGNAQTDKETLIRLGAKDERIKALHRVRDMGTVRTKFVKTPFESVKYNADGRTHPCPRIRGTYTTRMTYDSKTLKNLPTGFALHQMKRDKDVRDIVTAPDGWTIVEMDFSGQEMRIMADRSGDKNMIKIFNSGMDGHSWMTSKIYSLPYEAFILGLKDPATAQDYDFKRKNGKFTNLSQQYRIGKKKMVTQAVAQYDLWIDEDWAATLQNSYNNAFEMVAEYHQRQIAFARQHGYVEACDGSRVKLTQWNHRDAWALESTAINFPIQCTGAAMKYYAMHTLQRFVKAGARFMVDYHDGMYYCVRDDEALQMAIEMRATVDGLDYNKAWGWEPKVPMLVDLKIGKSWGSLEKVK